MKKKLSLSAGRIPAHGTAGYAPGGNVFAEHPHSQRFSRQLSRVPDFQDPRDAFPGHERRATRRRSNRPTPPHRVLCRPPFCLAPDSDAGCVLRRAKIRFPGHIVLPGSGCVICREPPRCNASPCPWRREGAWPVLSTPSRMEKSCSGHGKESSRRFPNAGCLWFSRG